MKDVLLGIVVGIANVIPGVSGGTFLFISGKYKKLIETVNLLLRFRIDREKFFFLLKLGAGIVFGILAFSKLLDFVYQNYREYCLAVFSGFITGGVVSISRKISFTLSSILTSIFAFAVSLLLFLSTPKDFPPGYFIVILGGIFAAFSMVLPGISGSFILLIMGIYDDAIHAVSKMDLKILIPLGAGVLVGLILAFKVLGFLTRRYWNVTMSFLLGLTLAGIVKIFPTSMNAIIFLFLGVSFLLALKFPKFFGE